ncbi:plasmid stabilization system protein ParE [Sphingomonas insulae]|uniref:Type II toxin-antitoxin system RelE/ParE family toxin n=1 Tax=Sphingomonas insulae TaxID=424800 RepID=A0ABN1HT56_9SPHN|nr:type II toxin-antitoxin system RelE/ParE family toxin [Sphingomonas insulae]NIJ28078.1 plasmid stabilization system protein ParE [Sphingomonas insulae]
MAEVVWPDDVIAKIDEITAYIAADDPIAAQKIAQRLIALGESLADFPDRRRPGRNGAREMTGVSPYIIRYRIIDGTVVIVDVRHGRRQSLS